MSKRKGQDHDHKPITYYVVQAFVAGEDGEVYPEDPVDRLSAAAAIRLAHELKDKKAGVIAFSRTGNPALGEWGDPVMLAHLGRVDHSALALISGEHS